MRAAHAGFLSDTTHCSMVMSEPICRTTVPGLVGRGRDAMAGYTFIPEGSGSDFSWLVGA